MRKSILAVLATPCLALAACTANSGGSATSSTAEAPASSASDMPTSAPAPQVSTVDGPCPYLEQSFIEQTAGQKISNTTVTTTTPAPGPLPRCEFQRASGEAVAVIDSLSIESGQGLAKALELVPGGNPVSAGEGGSVVVHKGEAKTELAAFKGTTLVLVTLNQESSLEATEIAAQVLQAG